MQQDNDYGIGIHWANEIELAMPVSRVNTAESDMTIEIAQLKAIEGSLRDALRLGKNRICLRTDSDKIIDKLNSELQNDVTYVHVDHSLNFHSFQCVFNFKRELSQRVCPVLSQILSYHTVRLSMGRNTQVN